MPIGRCLCGNIQFRAGGDLQFAVHCHCSMCRKSHGSAFATYFGIDASDFEWLSGLEKSADYESSPGCHRVFCTICGSVGPRLDSKTSTVLIPAGNLSDDRRAPPAAHIFVASKAPWYNIIDDIPQFDGYPPGFNSRELEAAARPHAHDQAISGSCLCGVVRFDYSGSPLRFVNCHCSRCRLARSAAHASNIFITPDQMRWIGGKGNITTYDLPGAERFGTWFCSICGSAVPRLVSKIGRVNVPGGFLDSDPGISPSHHIYVGSKAPWFDIFDDLPQFEGNDA